MTTGQGRRVKRVVMDGIDIPEPDGVVERVSEEPVDLTDLGDYVEARVSVGLPTHQNGDGWFSFTSRATRRAGESHDALVDRASFAARQGVFRTYFSFMDDYNELQSGSDDQ